MLRYFRASEGLFSHYAKLLCDTVIPFQEAVLRDEVEGVAPSHAVDNFRNAAQLRKTGKKPENGDFKAVIQVAHGMAEHLERYEKFAEALCNNGYALYINDHLGHGTSVKNEDELGYFGEKDGWKYFVEDCHQLTEIIKKENPSVPVVFFGHSMGSFVARAYSIK